MTIVELFNVVQNTAGTNAKKQILRDNMSPLVKAIFEAAYGEHKYFVTKLDRQYRDSDFGTPTIADGWFEFEQVVCSTFSTVRLQFEWLPTMICQNHPSLPHQIGLPTVFSVL